MASRMELRPAPIFSERTDSLGSLSLNGARSSKNIGNDIVR